MKKLINLAAIRSLIILLLSLGALIYILVSLNQQRDKIDSIQQSLARIEQELGAKTEIPDVLDNFQDDVSKRIGFDSEPGLPSDEPVADKILETSQLTKSYQRPKFSDDYLDDDDSKSQPQVAETANEYYQRIYNRLLDDGSAPERSALVSSTLTNVIDKYAATVSFSNTFCSEYQCIVKSSISESSFSVSSYAQDDFAAQKNYTLFLSDLNRTMSETMGRPIQVAITRFNDDAVLTILPKIKISGGTERAD